MQAPHMFIFYQVSWHQTIPCALPAEEAVEERCQSTSFQFLLICKLSLFENNGINYLSTCFLLIQTYNLPVLYSAIALPPVIIRIITLSVTQFFILIHNKKTIPFSRDGLADLIMSLFIASLLLSWLSVRPVLLR